MRRYISLFVVMVGVIFFSGCNRQKLKYEDTYIAGQDFPYMYYGSSYEFGVNTIETEDGYYKMVNQFIYYIDKNNMQTTPLCGKADCLHDQETAEKRNECNAYTNSNDGYLYQSGEYMYYMAHDYDKENDKWKMNLYQISMDGSERNIVCTVKEQNIYLWLIHRGYVYYVTNEKGNDGKRHNALKRFAVEDNSHKVETIKVLDEIYNGQPDTLEAYGNYVYFYTLGYNEDIENDLSKNWTKTLANCWFCYNITTSEVKEIFTEQRENNDTVKIAQHIRFWQDKLLTMYSYQDGKEHEDEKVIYQYDLDGNNKKKLLTVEDSMDCFCADNNYLYVYNTWRDTVADGKEEAKMIVYDKDLKEIDQIGMPMSPYTHLAPGNNECFLANQESEDTIAIIYMDKSKIGSYQGKQMEARACYETKKVDDQAGMEITE